MPPMQRLFAAVLAAMLLLAVMFVTVLSVSAAGIPQIFHPKNASDTALPQSQAVVPEVSPPVAPLDTRDQPLASADFPQSEGSEPAPFIGSMPLPHTQSLATFEGDPLVQTAPGQMDMPPPLLNFEGINNTTGIFPPDTDGQVGPDHYVQIVNISGSGSQVRIWNKSGVQLYNFTLNNLYTAGSRCQLYGYGDPVVVYDQMAGRWLLTQFTNPASGPYNECIAVSKTGTPTNNPSDWWLYQFDVHATKFNDYPKIGVWPDGYYMTANQFSGNTWAGAGVWVFERAQMLSGGSARFVYFDLYSLNSNYGGLLPSNLMGSTQPPAGAPNYLMSVDMDWSGSDDILHIFEVETNWLTPGNSTLTLIADLTVAPFDWSFSANSGAEVPQPGTTQGLDGLEDRLMMHLWYRNFGTHESLVVNHTVDAGSDLHGIRWYEIRGGAVDTTLADAVVYQQGTYAPDSHHRWMGSVAMDRMGNLALGYSVSSSSLYPSIRYAGRLVDDPLGTLSQAEEIIIAGGGSQTGADPFGRGRWGDYSAMSVDPVDDCTFWYTQEYIQTSGATSWRTRVASFKYPTCTSAPTGKLTGYIQDASTLLPVVGAMVTADDRLGSTGSTISGPDGVYTITLPVSSYTVTATAYTYTPQSVSGVVILDGNTTVQDFSLSLADSVTVSGTIRDEPAGWPLYTRLDIVSLPGEEVYPGNPVWSDPVSGFYSVTLPAGSAYRFQVETFSPGYPLTTTTTSVLLDDLTLDFELAADLNTCLAPGYQRPSGSLYQDFEDDFPPEGWLVLDNSGTGVAWDSCTSWQLDNYTGGSGDCAGVNSDAAAYINFDTELWSPVFDPSGLPTATLTYLANYQDYRSTDFLDLDVSTDGGSSWTNVLRWAEDHGVSRSTPGELVSIDLAPYLSGTNNRLRWHYYDTGVNDWDWYAEIDEVRLGSTTCVQYPGGLVVGHTLDENTAAVVRNAQVMNSLRSQETSLPTPDDPSVEDGFFIIHSPAGNQALSATALKYGTVTDTVAVSSGDVVSHTFHIPAGVLAYEPVSLTATLQIFAGITVPVTLTNTGGYTLSFDILEQKIGYQPLGPTVYQTVTIPAVDYLLSKNLPQRFRHRPPYTRAEVSFQVPSLPEAGFIDVLLLTPDAAAGGDISLISDTLAAYSDLNVSLWDAAQGDPAAADLADYDVVVIGNDYKWISAGMSSTLTGNALADYIDLNGKVIETMFVQDWAGWELGGRYMNAGYSPLTPSSSDYLSVPYSLGTVYEPAHPLFLGVTSIIDNPPIGIGHQNVGLAAGATRLADWNDGQIFIAYNQNVVAINQNWFHGAGWQGDAPTLLHNAIRYLALEDVSWIELPVPGGEIGPAETITVPVRLAAEPPDVFREAIYLASLIPDNDTPYPASAIPVSLTVNVPYQYLYPTMFKDYVSAP